MPTPEEKNLNPEQLLEQVQKAEEETRKLLEEAQKAKEEAQKAKEAVSKIKVDASQKAEQSSANDSDNTQKIDPELKSAEAKYRRNRVLFILAFVVVELIINVLSILLFFTPAETALFPIWGLNIDWLLLLIIGNVVSITLFLFILKTYEYIARGE